MSSFLWINLLYSLIFAAFRVHSKPILANIANIPSSELSALQDLFESTGGNEWNWDGPNGHWNFTGSPQPCEPANTWQGLTCTTVDLQYFIQEISLSDFNLIGSLPNSIGVFTQLISLDISTNHVNGTIPASIVNLTMLQNFDCETNSINGTIPEDFGSLTSLITWNMQFNNVEGPIPVTIGNAKELTNLYLSYNRMNGSIPSEISGCTKLEQFDIGTNFFSGSIPSTFSALSKLNLMYLFNNLLTGTIPDIWSEFHLMEHWEVNSNLFHGSLPESLYSMEKLQDIAVDYCYFTGTISSSITSLSNLLYCDYNNNMFNGTIPQNIGYMDSLLEFYWNNNELSGPIPESIVQSPILLAFNLGANKLTGPLPGNFSDECSLFYYMFYSNDLTGTIPEGIGKCTKMKNIYLFENHLSQTIPSSFDNLNVLEQLTLDENGFTGTLPPDALCDMNRLIFVTLAANDFDGPVPCHSANYSLVIEYTINLNSFTGELSGQWYMPQMQALDFSGNHLHGEVFEWIGDTPILNLLMIYDNLFSGSIGNINYPDMVNLQLYNNVLTGTLPPALSKMPVLELFLANNNRFSGSLGEVFNTSSQQSLTNLDISSNQLTGTIPDDWWSFSQLQVFGAAVNCIHGTVSEQICNCRQLTGLTMDGLLTATDCQNRFFPHDSSHKSYYLSNEISGSIPTCLFEMPVLSTLHLSGNGIGGSLISDLNISKSLTDLSLSHNVLTGSIPVNLQLNQWFNLDLSYNRFKGEISQSFAAQSNSTSVSLEVNRLSGVIPASVQNIFDIDILNGNMFTCNIKRRGLPTHDSDAGIYECGSNSLNSAMYVFAALFGCLVICGVMLYIKSHRVSEWLGSIRSITSFDVFCSALKGIRRWFTVLCMLCIFVLMPTYIALSYYYSTYTNAYSWVVSAAYLSGLTPAVVLLLVWIVLSISTIGGGLLLLESPQKAVPISLDLNESEKTGNVSSVEILLSVSLIVLSAFIVTLVNVAYVYIYHHYNAGAVLAMQLFVVAFKRIWNGVVVRYVLRLLSYYFHKTTNFTVAATTLLARIVLFNNLMAPFIATAFISSDCFYDVVETPSSVSTSFSVTNCIYYFGVSSSTSTYDDSCVEYSTAVSQTSYVPPFIYSYQCASTFIAAYTNVYVYMFVLIAFVAPAFQLLILLIMQKIKLPKSVHFLLKSMQWGLLRDVEITDNMPLTARKLLFSANLFTAELVTAFGILITFGVVFPPLAVVILVAVIVQTLSTELLIGRLLSFHRDQSEMIIQMLADCGQLMNHFGESVWVAVPIVTVFYAYILFDTLGNQVGLLRALWLPIIVCGLPTLIWLGSLVWDQVNLKRSAGDNDRSTLVEMSAQLKIQV